MDRGLENGRNLLIAESVSDFDELIDFTCYKKPFIPWPAKGVLAQRAMEHAESNKFIFAALMNDHSTGLEPILGEISPPVLVLWGEYDRVLDVSAVNKMQDLLPAPDVIIMKDTGHVPMIERPTETAEHYLSFIDRQ